VAAAPLHALILAAGEGKRMRSSTPKLLHRCAGLAVVEHVVRAARGLEAQSVTVVAAAGDEALREALQGYPVAFTEQATASGTADAIAAGCAELGPGPADVLVVNGDCPGVLTSTLAHLVAEKGDAAAVVLAVEPADRSGYGRLQLSGDGELLAIVEEADAGPEQLEAGPVNGGVYCFDLDALRGALDSIDADNAQGERYATRLFEALRQSGAEVRAVPWADADEVHGVNSRAELARAEALLWRRKLAALMDAGVTVRAPGSTWVDVDVQVGVDTVLYPGVTLEGNTAIGAGCTVYPGVRVRNSRVGAGVTLLDGSVVEESIIEERASIGPYARLRPKSEIGAGAKVGNFVETKATRLGAGSKAGHLTYLGNATIGEGVNIGAGTITCNYDGVAKHETIIGDGAFIGSNTALVAPVRIGANAYVGAGSTITEDVPDGALGLGRGRQVNKEAWAARQAAPDEDAGDAPRDEEGGTLRGEDSS